MSRATHTNIHARVIGVLKLMAMPETGILHALGGCNRQYLRHALGELRKAGVIHTQLKNRATYFDLGPAPTKPANEDDRNYSVRREQTERGTVLVKFGRGYRIRSAQTTHPRERGFSSLERV